MNFIYPNIAGIIDKKCLKYKTWFKNAFQSDYLTVFIQRKKKKLTWNNYIKCINLCMIGKYYNIIYCSIMFILGVKK